MIKNLALLGAAVLVAGCRTGTTLPDGYQGVVEYDDRVIAFEVPGRVAHVDVARGDRVVAGQPLAELDDTLQRLTCDARREDVAAAQADLTLLLAGTRREDVASLADDLRGASSAEDLARKTLERSSALVHDGALPQADLDKSTTELQRAEFERKSLEQRLSALKHGARPEELARGRARVDQARSVLALEEERLARFTLHAPTAGEVLDRQVLAGELAGVGTAAVTIADTTHPYVDVFVPQGEIDGVHPGAKATVRVDATSAPFPASVEAVGQETEFTPKFLFSERERPNLVVRVRLRVDDPERRLHSGVPAFGRVFP